MRILFASDLDNTLIHSYKYKKEGDICVEWIKDKEQSFMSKKAIENIREIANHVLFVPVTSRSFDQCKRIRWDKMVRPEFVITTNGALAFEHGKRIKEWEEKSEKIRDKYIEEMESIWLQSHYDMDFKSFRYVDSLFLYGVCHEYVNAQEKVLSFHTSLRVDVTHQKIYFMPPEFNKGMALEKLRDRFGSVFIIAAGDSMMDVPMLENADIAFYKDAELMKKNDLNQHIFTDENDLTEKVLNIVKNMR